MNSEEETEFQDWLVKAAADTAAKLKECSSFAGIVTPNFIDSPICALQLGLAILMDKPIVLVADRKVKMSKALLKIAQVIEYVDLDSKEDWQRAGLSIAKMAEGKPV